MVKIITNDTDHPFSFPEGRQSFISKPHPADEHAPGPLCLGAEFSFEYVQICRWRSVLMPLSFQQVKVIIQPEAAVNLLARVTECRAGESLKILKSSVSHASKRKPRGCGGRDFISFISAISEGQSTPCHTCTGLSPLAVSAHVFFSREISASQSLPLCSACSDMVSILYRHRASRTRRAVSRSTCFSKHLTRLAFEVFSALL
ncbi:Uncharacterised protein [Klebsiella pneumoniae]|nr:Uncharacterised protein [Klebsiella pneumoniae]